jgi:drug/metabolite transporter (DMT)-like permease
MIHIAESDTNRIKWFAHLGNAGPIVGLYASAVLLEESITWIELMALAMVLVALGLVLIGRDGLNALKRRHHK